MKKVKLIVTFLLLGSSVALLSSCASSQESAYTRDYKKALKENLSNSYSSKDNF